MNKEIKLIDLGLLDYKKAWDFQEKLFQEIIEIKKINRKKSTNLKTPNYLVFVEHPNVFTMGKNGDLSNLLVSKQKIREKNASFYKINRGGDITFHGPGQIVGYPILDLENFFTDIHKYLRMLEEVIILTLKKYQINALRNKGNTGVWLDISTGQSKKICAMGVRASRWVTMHGFALNVNIDLDFFKLINPCGLVNSDVTSMNKELNQDKINLNEVKGDIKQNFQNIFGCNFI